MECNSRIIPQRRCRKNVYPCQRSIKQFCLLHEIAPCLHAVNKNVTACCYLGRQSRSQPSPFLTIESYSPGVARLTVNIIAMHMIGIQVRKQGVDHFGRSIFNQWRLHPKDVLRSITRRIFDLQDEQPCSTPMMAHLTLLRLLEITMNGLDCSLSQP